MPDTDDEDIVTIICAPWSEEQLMALPGNRTRSCEVCNEPIVLSRQGQKLERESQRSRLLCMRCARREAPEEIVKPAPGAIEAALAAGQRADFSRRITGRRLIDVMNEDGEWLDG